MTRVSRQQLLRQVTYAYKAAYMPYNYLLHTYKYNLHEYIATSLFIDFSQFSFCFSPAGKVCWATH